VDLARADAAIAAAQLDKGTRELLTGVTQAFYGLVAAKKIDAVLTVHAGAVEEFLKLSNAPELRLGLLELRKDIAQTQKQIDELTATLIQLLNLPPCTCLELIEPALGPVPVACADEAAQLALVNNAQIREAEQSIAKAHAGLRAAKMEFLPDVNVLGGYVGQNATDTIQENFGFVGVMASYTFVDWGKRREVKRQREAQIALAGQNVRVVTESVQLEARKAFHAYKLAQSEAQIAAEVLRARRDAEKDAKEPHAAGAAKAATAKAQVEQMEADVAYRVAHAKLLGAIGQP
jgi:outer membrane protein TolC